MNLGRNDKILYPMKPKTLPTRLHPVFQLACGLLISVAATQAAEWPQYRGPNFDSSSPEKLTAKRWPANGPRLLWKAPLSDGFSSFTVSAGKAFTLVQREVEGAKREVCVALDANTGKEHWSVPFGSVKTGDGGQSGAPDNAGGDGPRSTPVVSDGRVYVMSAKLLLSCLEAVSGNLVWQKDLLKEHAGRNISWDNAASPVIDGNLVFVAGGGPGQSLLGINKKDGAVVWKVEDEKMTHSTPVVANILGARQVIFFTQSGLVSVAPKSGALLWRHPFPYKVSTAMSPIVSGDMVYCSAGYGVGAGACKITKTGTSFTATELWRKPNELPNHWSTPVVKDGYLYGMFQFKEYGKGPLKCVELATGKEIWSQPGFGPGGMILVDGHVVVLGDAGQLVLVEANPKAYTEVARAKVLEGKCWSTPVISNGRIYARSTKEGVCVDVAGKSAQR